MSYQPSTIPAGQIFLRGYQENSIFRHAQGIEAYHQLINYNSLPANRGVVWEIPFDFEILSIWVKCAAFPSESAKIDFSVSTEIAGSAFSTLSSLNLKARQIDDFNVWCSWSPPLTVIAKGLTFRATSNIATDIIYLAGKECYIHPAVYPSIISDL
ncbi:MAG: hypothetical protein ACKO1I_14660 [Microcystis aeruginosa]